MSFFLKEILLNNLVGFYSNFYAMYYLRYIIDGIGFVCSELKNNLLFFSLLFFVSLGLSTVLNPQCLTPSRSIINGYMYVSLYIHTCIYVCMYVCVYKYIHIYIYMHTWRERDMYTQLYAPVHCKNTRI